ncbi:MAG: HDOD domain-containing protein [Halomonadaceae bacterium]|nr:HDOD domain-containing protein [Halomonadaceae bacterium]
MLKSKGLAPFTIALHPVHDAELHHIADRLFQRETDSDHAEDLMSATARALTSAVYELGDSGLLGDRMLFVDLPREWLDRPELLPTPASRLVLGLAADTTFDSELPTQLGTIRERGYRIIVPANLFKQAPSVMLEHCDIVRLVSPTELDTATLQQLQDHGIKLLADQLASPQALESYRTLGCDYYNGSYLAQPSYFASPARGRHGNRAAQMRLIRTLYEEDGDLDRMHELVVQIPHLLIAILRRANSSHFNRGGTKIVDLQRAVQRLGLLELRRLILTLTLASLQPSAHIVLRMALIRAFMCRNLAAGNPAIDAEDAFTTGLFSMMDALMEEDRDTLFEQLPLSRPIIAAVKQHSGPLGAVLAQCQSHEQQVDAAIEAIPGDRLHTCYMQALASTTALMDRL